MEVFPAAGDVVRTRYIWLVGTKTHALTFYWKIVAWDESLSLNLWLVQVAQLYLEAMFGWFNRNNTISCCRYRNISNGSLTYEFPMLISGPVTIRKTMDLSATIWVQRYGTDSFGNVRRSGFPISTLSVPISDGRVDGDGQPPGLDFFLTAEQDLEPALITRWYGGFRSKINGEFVRTTKSSVNPVVKSLKKRKFAPCG